MKKVLLALGLFLALQATPAVATSAACVPTTDYHTELIYARAYDDTDQYATRGPLLRSEFEQVNEILNNAAIETGSTSAAYKVACDGGVPTVHNAVLPTSLMNDTHASVRADLRNLGYTDLKVKYLVLYDAGLEYPGQANFCSDDRLISTNGCLVGAMFAVSTSATDTALMHELSHTMGAVHDSAPHATGASHCYDGYDIMCYNDGGPSGGLYSASYCPDLVIHFDCNYDDYFNTHPAPGSYLATHWNIGHAYNQYLQINFDAPPPPPDTEAPEIWVAYPNQNTLHSNNCTSFLQPTTTGRPQFRVGDVGCMRFSVTDNVAVDRLSVGDPAQPSHVFYSFPTPLTTFNHGASIPHFNALLRVDAWDTAGNQRTIFIAYDVI